MDKHQGRGEGTSNPPCCTPSPPALRHHHRRLCSFPWPAGRAAPRALVSSSRNLFLSLIFIAANLPLHVVYAALSAWVLQIAIICLSLQFMVGGYSSRLRGREQEGGAPVGTLGSSLAGKMFHLTPTYRELVWNWSWCG